MIATGLDRLGAVRPIWWGIAVLAGVTEIFIVSWPAQMFSYNLFLLAIIGAVALNILVGTTGLLSLGNSSFLAVGAFGTAFGHILHVPFPLDIAIGVVAAGIVGAIVGLPATRLRGFDMALATLAGFFIIDFAVYEFQTHSSEGGVAGFIFNILYASHPYSTQKYTAWTFFAVVSLVLLAATQVMRGRSGRAMRMIRDHEVVAGTLGVRVVRYKLVVFAITSSVVGLEGGLFAYLLGSANETTFTLQLSINYLAMVLVGGADTVIGSVIGAALITALPVVLPNIIGKFTSSNNANLAPGLSVTISGLLLVGFIVVAPSGIAGLVTRLVAFGRRVLPRPRQVGAVADVQTSASEV